MKQVILLALHQVTFIEADFLLNMLTLVPHPRGKYLSKNALFNVKSWPFLFALSDLGETWAICSTLEDNHLTQVTPKSDNSFLYFPQLCPGQPTL